jgi:glycine/D-amino acid oxidase-like deaminating enzyme
LNVGYSGHGVMGSPDGGRLAVDLITGRVSDAENPFSYGRFAKGLVALTGEKMVR